MKWEEVLYPKLISGEELTEDEIRRLVDWFEIECTEGDDRRWSRSMGSICQVRDRFFEVQWDKGLTEMQENSYYNQPIEVIKQTREELIPAHIVTIIEWVAV